MSAAEQVAQDTQLRGANAIDRSHGLNAAQHLRIDGPHRRLESVRQQELHSLVLPLAGKGREQPASCPMCFWRMSNPPTMAATWFISSVHWPSMRPYTSARSA